jgi:ELWxxDGT repeat protein
MNVTKSCVSPIQLEAVKATICDLLVVFDSRVPDLSVLLGAVVEGARYHVLSEEEDAIAVVTQWLADSAAKRLALVAHGESGILHLGANPLNEEQLQVQSRLLQEWGVEEISLYSCEVAKDEKGKSFVTQFSELTGAKVAASEAQIGKGFWSLDSGNAQTRAALVFKPEVLCQYTATLSSSVRYDFSSGSLVSRPDNLLSINGTVYFSADDGISGRELWKIDPSIGNNPVLIADIEPGSGASNPNNLTNVNGTLYFSSFDSIYGTELWKIDPITGNPLRISDIEPGSGSSNPSNLTNVNGTLYFSATDSSNGTELWKIDPSTGNSVLIADINTGSGASNPSNLTNVNGTLYFSATDSSNGTELWKIDPITGNPLRITDIEPGSGSSNPYQLTNVNGTLYFGATNSSNGTELWKIDSATGNPVLLEITSGNAPSGPSFLTNFNGTLYFRYYIGNGVRNSPFTQNFLLAKIDPVTGNPVVVNSNAVNYQFLININNTLYFDGFALGSGNELWKIDPTMGEMRLGITYPSNLTNVNGTLYFNISSFSLGDPYNSATYGTYGSELWKFAPATGKAILVRDFNPGPGSSDPTILGYDDKNLYVSVDSGNGPELWAISLTNNAPVLTGTQAAPSPGTEDIAYTINVADLLVGFSDADADTLSIFGLSASNGTIVNNNNGTYTLTPAANFNGALTLTYTVIDNSGGSTTSTQSIYFAPDNGGVSSGDPHLVTFDQFHYDFQATGDFVLTRALDSDLEVQVRQAPWVLNPDTTLNVALATLVDGNHVEFYIDQPAPIVNGVLLALQTGQSQSLGQGLISRTSISGYGMLGDLYTITYPNGDVLTNKVFQGFLMDPSLDLAGSKAVTGLLGNNNGNAGDDLVLQDGLVLSNPLDPNVLYGDFANSWRVSDAQSLFSSAVSLAALNLGPSNAQSLKNDVASVFENFVFGGNGDDTLVGVQNLLVNPGRGEVDLLMGNKGADTFVLGDRDNRYYVGLDQQDYALITDFWAEDSIQLYGSAKDYVLGAAPKSLAPGTGIFLAANPNELIGIIQGNAVIDLNLSNTNLFHFV